MKNASWIALLVSVAGCSQVARELHPWQSLGNAFSFRVETAQWTFIEPRYLGRVIPERVAEASHLLKASDAVELAPDKARQMCPAAQFDFSGELKRFLIRGVSYGTPLYSIVKLDKQSGWVYFLQATGTGELYIPGVRYSPGPAPIVILLENKPVRVICAGSVAGDAIFRSVDFRKIWND